MAQFPLTSEDHCPQCGHHKSPTHIPGGWAVGCKICAAEGCKCDQCPGHNFARVTSTYTMQCINCGMETRR